MFTNKTKDLQITKANLNSNFQVQSVKYAKVKNESKLHVVYRLDFAIKLKEKGHIEVYSRRNPQKPWLYCWYFVETEAFLTDLQDLMEEVKNGKN